LSLRSKHYIWPAAYESLLLDFPPASQSYNLQLGLVDTVQRRLEVLSLGTEAFGLQLDHMQNLKAITIVAEPQYGLGYSTSRNFPPSLEALRIYCDQSTCPWNFLNTMRQEMVGLPFHPLLRQVQLFFGHSCRSMAHYAVYQTESGRRRNFRILGLLEELQTRLTSFETYFLICSKGKQGVLDPKQYRQANLAEEIKCVEEEAGRSINFSV